MCAEIIYSSQLGGVSVTFELYISDYKAMEHLVTAAHTQDLNQCKPSESTGAPPEH